MAFYLLHNYMDFILNFQNNIKHTLSLVNYIIKYKEMFIFLDSSPFTKDSFKKFRNLYSKNSEFIILSKIVNSKSHQF